MYPCQGFIKIFLKYFLLEFSLKKAIFGHGSEIQPFFQP